MREAARLPDQLLSVKRWELDPTKTSVLEGVKKFEKGMPGGRRPPVVFFSLFGKWFLRYSFDTARVLYAGITLATLVLITFFETRRPGPNARRIAPVTLYALSLTAVGISIVGGVFVANTVAFIMRSIMDRQLSWFQQERRCLWLYAPATILGMSDTSTLSWSQKYVLTNLIGMLSPLSVISSYVHRASRPRLERATIHAALLWCLFAANGLQYLGIGSAMVFVLLSIGMSSGLAIGETTELLFGRLNSAVSPVVCTYT